MNKLTKKIEKRRGFTIVELLVVIVVIAILAAITIVSYTGITARAKTSQGQSNGQSVQSVAEVYFTENSHYPRLTTDFASTVAAKLPSGLTLLTGAQVLSTNKVPTEALYQYCGAVAAPAAGAEIGGRIQFWDFTTAANSTTVFYFGTGAPGLGVGVGTVCNTWVTPAS